MGRAETDLAYAAGFYDGEGCVGIHYEGHIYVAFTQKRPSILYWLQDLFSAGNISPNKLVITKSVDIVRVGKLLLPYLKCKKRKLEIAIAIAETIPSQGKKPTPRELLLRHKLIELLEVTEDE